MEIFEKHNNLRLFVLDRLMKEKSIMVILKLEIAKMAYFFLVSTPINDIEFRGKFIQIVTKLICLVLLITP